MINSKVFSLYMINYISKTGIIEITSDPEFLMLSATASDFSKDIFSVTKQMPSADSSIILLPVLNKFIIFR